MYNYDYGYDYDLYDYGASSMQPQLGAPLVILLIVSLLLSVLLIVSMWKIYKKAGKPGWAAIVPIYNIIVLLEITELPLWYLVLFIVPFANIYAMFKIYIELAHKFGKSTGFGVASLFFSVVCFPILAFNKNIVYKNSSGDANNLNMVNAENDIAKQLIDNNGVFGNSQNEQNTNNIPNYQPTMNTVDNSQNMITNPNMQNNFNTQNQNAMNNQNNNMMNNQNNNMMNNQNMQNNFNGQNQNMMSNQNNNMMNNPNNNINM